MLHIAAVSADDIVRLQLARAFDRAPASWIVSLHETPPADADVVVCGPDRDVEGCVKFDPSNPLALVADIESRVVKVARRPIFVVGAHGGTGATTLALHLAAIASGYLFETSAGGVTTRLNMPSARTWTPDADDEVDLTALPVAPGFRVLPAPSCVTAADTSRVLAGVLRAFDPVFVDAVPALLPSLVQPRDVGVLVLAPTRPAAERGRLILDAHGDVRWAVVTNRLGPGSNMTARRLAAILGRDPSLELPCTPALRDREDEGRLITSPLSPWLWRVKRLWRALAAA